MVATTRASLQLQLPSAGSSTQRAGYGGARISDVLRATKSGLNRAPQSKASSGEAKPSKRPTAARAMVEPATAPTAAEAADRAVKREIEDVPSTVSAIAESASGTRGRPAKRARTLKPESLSTPPSTQHPEPPALHPGILDDALTHLTSVDARFGPLSRRFICRPWTAAGMAVKPNHFRSLALGIMSQQVSGAAARSISRKFVALFHPPDAADAADAGAGAGAGGGGVKRQMQVDVEIDPEVEDGPDARTQPSAVVTAAAAAAGSAPAMDSTATANGDAAPREEFAIFPSPAEVAAADVLYLKSAGLSLRKAEYVQGLAAAFVSGLLSDDFFATSTDADIVARLTSLRGLGPWSAEMFLMFSLRRLDVLSYGDIGIQRGMSYWLGRDARNKATHVVKGGNFKFVTQGQMDDLSDTWRPYRSIGCWFMWRVDSVIDHLSPPEKQEQVEAEEGLKVEPDIEMVGEHEVKQEEV